MDVTTLFVANAAVTLVMGGSFLAAWVQRAEQDYWLSWALSCAALTVAFVSFAMFRHASLGLALPLALLVLGFGLRWRAARQFTGHVKSTSDGSFWVLAPTLVLVAMLLLPGLVNEHVIYLAGNTILACQTAAIAWHFYAHCEDTGISRWGLILAYGIAMVAFATCTVQATFTALNFEAFLHQDRFVSVCLLMALIHGVASGTFALAMAFTRAESHVRQQHALAEERARSFSRLAERDALTGLMNRRAVESRFSGLQRSGFVTVAVLDLDHFKDINDRFGHAKGDEVLRATAGALTPDEDCLAVRLGGEEFMLILRGEAGRDRAEQRRQAIADHVAQQVDGLDRAVTASMGVVELPLCELSLIPFSDFYIAADRLLYQAKQQGRNRAAFGSLAAGADGERVPTPAPQCLSGEMQEPCGFIPAEQKRSPLAANG